MILKERIKFGNIDYFDSLNKKMAKDIKKQILNFERITLANNNNSNFTILIKFEDSEQLVFAQKYLKTKNYILKQCRDLNTLRFSLISMVDEKEKIKLIKHLKKLNKKLMRKY